MRLKKDHDIFSNILNQLKQGQLEVGLSNHRRWIPKYVYHFTDLNNACEILKQGCIYSRNQAIERNMMRNDNASYEVMGQTNNKWKSYVRFYLRPKTPTQYRNEGVRSKHSLTYDAHCPVPVFFLFDSESMFCREDSWFSFGSLATDTTDVYNTGAKFREMPFELIYHEGPYDPVSQSHIKFHRHSELIIPNQCSLDSLKAIVCRSTAEKETLLNSLSPETRNLFASKIQIDTRQNFFFRHWTYVESVNMSTEEIAFTMHKKAGDQFKTSIELQEFRTGSTYSVNRKEYNFGNTNTFKLGLSKVNFPENYAVKLFLDDNLVYFGYYIDDSLPF